MKTAIYNLDKFPCSYDFLTFCIIAKSHNVQHIIFSPQNKFTEFNRKPYSVNEKFFRLTHILYPLCSLMSLDYSTVPFAPECNTVTWAERPHFLSEILKRYKEHNNLEWPQPSCRAKEIIRNEFPEKPIVITLRETYTQGRNSNIHAWLKFADYALESNPVVFIRDTAKFNEELKDDYDMPYPCFSAASIDVDLRLALYQWAKLNMSVGGGPTILLHYSQDIPYLSFKLTYDGYKSSSVEFLTEMGFPPGSQFPWCGRNQRIVWADDSYENLKNFYDNWLDNQDKPLKNRVF